MYQMYCNLSGPGHLKKGWGGLNLDGQMKEIEPQLTIGNWRKTNGVTVEKKKKIK